LEWVAPGVAYASITALNHMQFRLKNLSLMCVNTMFLSCGEGKIL